MRVFEPVVSHWPAFNRFQHAERLLAIRDVDGRLRRVDPASTVSGSRINHDQNDMLRDIAWLIARKKR